MAPVVIYKIFRLSSLVQFKMVQGVEIGPKGIKMLKKITVWILNDLFAAKAWAAITLNAGAGKVHWRHLEG